jgi:hypothetical protein
MARRPDGDDPLVPADFSSWMGKIVDAFARSWRPLILLQLVLAVPLAILLALFQEAAGSRTGVDVSGSKVHWTFDHPGAAVGVGVGLVVVALVVGALVQLASLWVVIRQAAGRDCPPREAFQFAIGRVAPLVGWQLLAGVAFLVITYVELRGKRVATSTADLLTDLG